MQKTVVILLRTGNATGRNALAGVLRRIKDSDRCAVRIATPFHDEGQRMPMTLCIWRESAQGGKASGMSRLTLVSRLSARR